MVTHRTDTETCAPAAGRHGERRAVVPAHQLPRRRLPRPGRLPRLCRRPDRDRPRRASSRPAAPASSSRWTRTSTGRSSPPRSRRPAAGARRRRNRLRLGAGRCVSPGSPRRRARTPRSSCRTTWSPPRRTGWSSSWSGSPPAPGCRSSPTSAARSPSTRRRAAPDRRRSRRHRAQGRPQRPRPAPAPHPRRPEGFLFFNGAATAEIQARAYATVGVPAYSSAVHAFAPEIANAFFAALRDGDDGTVERLLRDFYVPLVELRDRVPGYAVSLVKAAARLRGRPRRPGARPAHRPLARRPRRPQRPCWPPASTS